VVVDKAGESFQKRDFLPPAKGPQKTPKQDKLRNMIVSMRKQNLSVYDISGRLVAELVNGWRDAGVHEVTFDGAGL